MIQSDAMSTNQVAPVSEMPLESSRRYQVLTDRQKVFVTAYLTSGDAVNAVQMAFRCKDEKSAKVMSYQVLQHPKVADCLAEFQGKTELEIQIEGARRDVLKAPAYEKANARRLLCELEGLLVEPVKTAAKLAATPTATDCGTFDAAPAEAAPNVSDGRVPAGAKPLHDKTGTLKGYISAAGEYVQLAAVEVAK